MRWLLDQYRDSPRHRRAARLPLHSASRTAALALSLIVLVTGCGKDEQLTTDYGHRRGRAATSVNGTSVLAGMFRQAGARPVTVLNLSSRLDKYDVIVWTPDDFTLPTEEVREFLENWLAGASGRTLVFIGRDYNAACDYWQAMVPQAPAEQRIEVMRRAAVARSVHSRARIEMPAEECCEWFVMRRGSSGRHANVLSGRWSAGVDVSQSRIWSQGRLDIPTDKELAKFWKNNHPSIYSQPDYAPLLTSGKETPVFEVSKSAWDTSRILVVVNGSFLLNLPLVNHSHRQLAERLIDECQPFSAVAFLESESGGPSLRGEIKNVDEDSLRSRVLLAAHWFLLGTVFCFFVFPIFGRPKSIETETVADFGQHIDAMASLLERTRDTRYAQRQLDLYHKGQCLDKPNDSTTVGSVAADMGPRGSKDST